MNAQSHAFMKIIFFSHKEGSTFGVFMKSEGSYSTSIIGGRHFDDYIVL